MTPNFTNRQQAVLLFSLDPSSTIAPAVAARLGIVLAAHEDRAFEDGEHKLRPLVDPRGHDVFVLASLHGGPRDSPQDKLFALLAFIATLRDHGAARVVALVPYLAYARKDRVTKAHDPVTLRYVAQLFEAIGADRVVVLEVHNVAAFQNAFRCPVTHLDAWPAFEPWVLELVGGRPVAVASPDPGGVKRAQLCREALQARLQRPVGFAMIDKRRSDGAVTSQNLVAGDVAGQTVLLYDDLVASGDTMRRGALALRQAGAADVIALAAHGLFVGAAAQVLADPAISQLVVTDSVPPFRLPAGGPALARLRVVPVAPLFAQVIAGDIGALAGRPGRS